MNDEEAIAAITLSLMPGLTLSQALQVVRHYGSACAAFADTGQSSKHWREAFKDQSGLRSARERALREMEFCEKHGIEVIPVSSSKYPELLASCNDAPVVLFYRGTASLNRAHTISVVGTRRITDYGRRLCRQFCHDLAEALPDCLVVSGLAYGVDVHTHRAALENGLETVGILAHGLDRIYPAMHRNTAAEMTHQGGLLTEYLSGTIPEKGNFIRRNRIVAGLSPLTIIVESAAKGGALVTARLAGSYNREVMAFPGRVGDEFSEGCNALLANNEASIISSADDVLKMMNWKKRQEKKQAEELPQLFPPSEFSSEAQAIIHVLRGTDGLHQNRIIELTHLDPHTVISTISMLQVEGTVCRMQAAGVYALSGI